MCVPSAQNPLQFDKIYKLVGVPVITVQLRYDGWVTEMKVRAAQLILACARPWPLKGPDFSAMPLPLQNTARVKDLRSAAGLDNLLYSADTYFSCFADLALTSPVEYFREGQGSLMQVGRGGAGRPGSPASFGGRQAVAARSLAAGRTGRSGLAPAAHAPRRARHVLPLPVAFSSSLLPSMPIARLGRSA
jgi:hypothetical protein